MFNLRLLGVSVEEKSRGYFMDSLIFLCPTDIVYIFVSTVIKINQEIIDFNCFIFLPQKEARNILTCPAPWLRFVTLSLQWT